MLRYVHTHTYVPTYTSMYTRNRRLGYHYLFLLHVVHSIYCSILF